MTFAWPGMLWLLVLVPVLAAIQARILRRRRQAARRYEHVFQLTSGPRRGRGGAGLLPPVLFLLGVTVSVVALARPSAVVMLPSQRGTVILSLDVSGSMKAQDIKPTRMDAVKEAARAFVKVQPRGVRFGIVAFSSTAILVQPPTSDKAQVLAAIDRLAPQMYTAIGSGLLTALDAIFPKPASEAPEGPNAPLLSAPAPEPPAVAPGTYSSAVIILLSDGQSNQGPPPLDAAEEAANRGVRVFTVGVGTREGTDLTFGGFTFHAILDEATLKRIAAITGGSYFKASSAEELRGIYQSLGARIELEKKNTEITALAAGAAVVLFLLMAALSLAWFNRLL